MFHDCFSSASLTKVGDNRISTELWQTIDAALKTKRECQAPPLPPAPDPAVANGTAAVAMQAVDISAAAAAAREALEVARAAMCAAERAARGGARAAAAAPMFAVRDQIAALQRQACDLAQQLWLAGDDSADVALRDIVAQPTLAAAVEQSGAIEALEAAHLRPRGA